MPIDTEAIKTRAKAATQKIAWSHFPNIVKDFYRKDIPALLEDNEDLEAENKKLRKCLSDEWDGVAVDKILTNTEKLQDKNKELREALEANVRRCEFWGDKNLCGKIGVHMMDDYDSPTEYKCDEHKGQQGCNTDDSGEFAPSRLAMKALKGE